VTAQSPAWVDAATDIGKVENFDCWALFGNRVLQEWAKAEVINFLLSVGFILYRAAGKQP